MQYPNSISLTDPVTRTYNLAAFELNGRRLQDTASVRRQLLAGDVPEGMRAIYREAGGISCEPVCITKLLSAGIPETVTLIHSSRVIIPTQTP